MVATLLDTATPGQIRPSRADLVDLVAGAARQWLGVHTVRGLGDGLRIAAPLLLGFTAANALSAWLSNPDWQLGSGWLDGVVAVAWLSALLTRSLVPRISPLTIALAWLVTVAGAAVSAMVSQAPLPHIYQYGLIPGWIGVDIVAGLVAFIGMATVPTGPSTRERVALPAAVLGLVGSVLLVAEFGSPSMSPQPLPFWGNLVWLAPLVAFLIGLGVLGLAGSARWLWAAVWLLPLAPIGVSTSYGPFRWYFPPLWTLNSGSALITALTLMGGVLVATVIGLAALAATEGPAAAYHAAGSLSLGTAAGVCLYVVGASAYDGSVDRRALLLLPTLVCTLVAIVVPPVFARVLVIVALLLTLAGTYALASHGPWVEFATMGALVVLLSVASVAGPPRNRSRRIGVGALAGAPTVIMAAATITYGQPFPSPLSQDAQAMLIPGVAAVVLLPMLYWSARRLMLAARGWVAAVAALAGSVLWLCLLIGPAQDAATVAGLVGVVVIVMIGARLVARRVPATVGSAANRS
ncbi:MAG TPA: hypothetical protein VF163_01230, partial [Micromonosporaceae bacterium]